MHRAVLASVRPYRVVKRSRVRHVGDRVLFQFSRQLPVSLDAALVSLQHHSAASKSCPSLFPSWWRDSVDGAVFCFRILPWKHVFVIFFFLRALGFLAAYEPFLGSLPCVPRRAGGSKWAAVHIYRARDLR